MGLSNPNTKRDDISAVLWDRSVEQAADYISEHLNDVLVFEDRDYMGAYIIDRFFHLEHGVHLEFGVFQGNSINYFSKALPKISFYGFDSFEGLAEDWSGYGEAKGAFNLDGKLPEVNSNVTLVKGWFADSLPEFVRSHSECLDKMVCLYVDSDTYQAATTVLTELRDYIRPGLFVVFDEYLAYPNWKNGEFKAWQEFCQKNNVKYRYRAFHKHMALIEVVEQ